MVHAGKIFLFHSFIYSQIVFFKLFSIKYTINHKRSSEPPLIINVRFFVNCNKLLQGNVMSSRNYRRIFD